MSAFLCNAEHIGRLARFYAARNPGRESAEQVAKTLAIANLKSVGDRYEETADQVAQGFGGTSDAATYVAACVQQSRRLDHGLTSVAAIKMADCLDYQSCEVDNWKHTEAYDLIQAIQGAAHRALPGYDAAPWEYREGA